jgi:hypothetical protein
MHLGQSGTQIGNRACFRNHDPGGGARAALNQLYDQLVPFVDEPKFASRVRYWRGFAKWRRAINGFGETPTPKDLSEDLTDAEGEFDAAI